MTRRAKNRPQGLAPYRNRAPSQNRDPLVAFLFEQMRRQRISDIDIAKRVGMHRSNLGNWRRHSMPDLALLQACFNVLGFEIKPVRLSAVEQGIAQ